MRMAQRIYRELTMLDRLRSQFVTPGFERNSGHLSLIGSSLEIYLKNADIRKNIMNDIDGAAG